MHLLLDARDLPPTVSSLSLVHGHLDTRHDITHTSHTTVQHCPRQRNLRAESNAKQTDATIHTDDGRFEDTGYHACNVATRHETVNECSNAALDTTRHPLRYTLGIPRIMRLSVLPVRAYVRAPVSRASRASHRACSKTLSDRLRSHSPRGYRTGGRHGSAGIDKRCILIVLWTWIRRAYASYGSSYPIPRRITRIPRRGR